MYSKPDNNLKASRGTCSSLSHWYEILSGQKQCVYYTRACVALCKESVCPVASSLESSYVQSAGQHMLQSLITETNKPSVAGHFLKAFHSFYSLKMYQISRRVELIDLGFLSGLIIHRTLFALCCYMC